jgi:hypothetical protein
MVLNSTYFQQYFSYIVAVSFIGGGNRNTRRKPLKVVILFFTGVVLSIKVVILYSTGVVLSNRDVI